MNVTSRPGAPATCAAVNTCPSLVTITPLPCAGPTRTPTVDAITCSDRRCTTACIALRSSTVWGDPPAKIADGSRRSELRSLGACRAVAVRCSDLAGDDRSGAAELDLLFCRGCAAAARGGGGGG